MGKKRFLVATIGVSALFLFLIPLVVMVFYFGFELFARAEFHIVWVALLVSGVVLTSVNGYMLWLYKHDTIEEVKRKERCVRDYYQYHALLDPPSMNN